MLKSEREIDTIRGKMLCGAADNDEIKDFLSYVIKLEELVENASCEDFYGTEGWKHSIGWE